METRRQTLAGSTRVRSPVALVTLMAVLGGGGLVRAMAEPVTAPPVSYERLQISGELNQSGIFDPSVEYDTDGRVGWLAYTSFRGPQHPFEPYLETHLARSDDHGRTWSYVTTPNPAYDDQLVYADGRRLPGTWVYEVPSLVHDPDDPGREWKLFAHRNVVSDALGHLPAYGWIVLRHAANPAGPWSEEIPLLCAGPFPPAPYRTTQLDVNGLHRSLANNVAYTEPGAFSRAGRLYLSLIAVKAHGPARIILLASSDHGASWEFVGTLLTREDARALGYLHFDGSAITEDQGRAYLLVTPATSEIEHDGTLVIPFTSLTRGELRRNGQGLPVVRKHIRAQAAFLSSQGGGQSDYHEQNTEGGLLMPRVNLPASPELFQIFQTHERLNDRGTFEDPQPVTIRGYAGEAMEPFISRDGQYLFFNNLNNPQSNTNLHAARRIDDVTFEYLGEIGGVNTPALEGGGQPG